MLDFKKMKQGDLVKYIEDHLQNPAVPSTVIFEDKPLRNDLHPTMKPIKLLARLMVNSSIKGNIVLDPFAGSGSTLIAADLTGRTARLIELDERFCDVIIRRYIMTADKRDISLLRGNQKLKAKTLMNSWPTSIRRRSDDNSRYERSPGFASPPPHRGTQPDRTPAVFDERGI